VEFRSTLFRELSERAARVSESDPGDWQQAAEAWREQQVEARKIANERLERAILDAVGEQERWDRERWRSVLLSLSRGWADE
jgi:prephenate dehydrogenase